MITKFKKKFLFLILVLFLISPVFAQFNYISGSGTAADPYKISNLNGWNEFASKVNNDGNSFAGQYFELTNNITVVNKSIGVAAFSEPSVDNYNPVDASTIHPFSGIFNGKGYTISVTFANSNKGNALFKCVKDAVITNLHVSGSIINNSTKCFAAGLVAYCTGDTVIQNCRSSVIFNLLQAGESYSAGFVSHLENGSLLIENCLFDGKFTGNGCSSSYGFVIHAGYSEPDLIIKDCYFKPSAYDKCASFFYNDMSYNKSNIKLENCFYDYLIGLKGQGSSDQSYTIDGLCSALGTGWQVSGEEVIPANESTDINNAVISGIKKVYLDTADISSLTIQNLNGSLLTQGTDYTLSEAVTDNIHTLTISGIGNYSGSRQIEYTIAQEMLGRWGFLKDSEGNYLIQNTQDFNNFARYANTQMQDACSDLSFKMTKDIDFEFKPENFRIVSAYFDFYKINEQTNGPMFHLEAPNAIYRKKSFAGSFDGNNHTISGVYVDYGSLFCGDGIFGTTTNTAVIKNLTLKNARFRGQGHLGGIVGDNNGTIQNCHVTDDVNIISNGAPNSGESGQLCHGGIAGKNFGNALITGCTSAATVEALHANHSKYGGIIGENNGTVKDCFYYGTKVKSNTSYGAICGTSSGTVENCLHICTSCGGISNQDNENAAFAFIVQPADEYIRINLNGDFIDYGKLKAAAASMFFNDTIYAGSGITLSFTLSHSDSSISTDNLIFDYVYDTGSQIIDQSFTKNPDGTYSFTMPVYNVTIFGGYEIQGNGTLQEPYLICSAKQLSLLAYRVNLGKKDYEDNYFVLTNNIIFDAENNFNPIGCKLLSDEKNFNGSFDGKGYWVSGLIINKAEKSDSNKFTGLFGRLGEKAVIKNLIIKNSSIKGYVSTGAIAGYNKGSINNCRVEGSVTVSSTAYDSCFTGGLVGYNEGNITGCTCSAIVKGISGIGGITGCNKNGTIKHCLFVWQSSESLKAQASFAGSITGRQEGGTLLCNLYTNSQSCGIGTAEANKGLDIEGALPAFVIDASSPDCTIDYSFNTTETPVAYSIAGTQFYDSNGWLAYASKLYSAKGKNVSLNLTFSAIPQDKDPGITGFGGNLKINKDNNNIYSFTMPAYDVTVTLLTKDTVILDSVILIAMQDIYSQSFYYKTFYDSKNNYKVDSDTEVYYAVKNKNGKINLQKEESGIINKGQGVILKSSKEQIKLTLTEEAGEYSKTNLLKGTDAQIDSAPEGTYVLTFTQRGGAGFIPWTGIIGANKAYLFIEVENEE